MVQDNIRTIKQIISAIESNADGQSIATGYIMGGRNERAAFIKINNNQSIECLVHVVKVHRTKYQVTTNGYDIDEPETGTIAVNDLNTNSNMCCFRLNFTVLKITFRTTDVYPYDY